MKAELGRIFQCARDRVPYDGPAFLIAEAGVNHNGNEALALRLVEAAADAGVDAVKFQTFVPEALVAARAPLANYQRSGTDESDQLSMLRGLCLSPESYDRLKRAAEGRGIAFLSTPFDVESAVFLTELGVPALKVSSGEVTNLPFLSYLSKLGPPLILSTGMSTLKEVESAVLAISENRAALALLHCVSSYPTVPADCNLRAIVTMRDKLRLPVGWSDHTRDPEVSLAAAAIGAAIVEKHITLDRGMKGPDHPASTEPQEFAALVRSIRLVEAARGDGIKQPCPSEAEVALVARRSLYWIADFPVGHSIVNSDLISLRPGNGLAPALLHTLTGRPLSRVVRKGSQAQLEDVDARQST